MYSNAQKQEFSKAWVHAVATIAGLKVLRAEVDDDSIDIGLAGSRHQGSKRKAPHLDIQLKCTETDDGLGDSFSFNLKLKNYQDLRDLDRHVPAILVVLCVPPALGEWMHETADSTIVRRVAYWRSLAGEPDTDNATGKTIVLQRASRFTSDSLNAIMNRVGAGDRP